MNANCTLALRKTHRVGNTVLRRNAQTHVDMVQHAAALQKFNATTLATQFRTNRTDFAALVT